jgi:hypothetical protein
MKPVNGLKTDNPKFKDTTVWVCEKCDKEDKLRDQLKVDNIRK